MPIHIEDADPNSTEAIALIRNLSAELGARYGDDGSGAFTPDDVLVARAAFVIAWQDKTAVGCGALRPMADDSIAEIKRMYVRKAARGQGISRKILAALETRAAQFGYQQIWLETGTRQPEAMRLYETSGYQRIACYGMYADDPLSVCYGKHLAISG